MVRTHGVALCLHAKTLFILLLTHFKYLNGKERWLTKKFEKKKSSSFFCELFQQLNSAGNLHLHSNIMPIYTTELYVAYVLP